MNAVAAILAKLNEVFAPMDAKVAEDSRAWGLARRDAIKAKAAELNRRALGEWSYYEEMFKAAGGKTWYGVLNGASDAAVVEFMDKNSAAVVAKRNASIAAKLEKAEVTEVVSMDYGHTNDGFNGRFVVNTNKGRKSVIVDTIRAGGWNIQCFHLRTLVKVK